MRKLVAPAIVAGIGAAMVIGAHVAQRRQARKLDEEIRSFDPKIHPRVVFTIFDGLDEMSAQLDGILREIEPEFHSHSEECGARFGCPGC